MIVFVSVLAPRIVRPPPGEIVLDVAVVNASVIPVSELALSPPDVALRPSRVVNAPSVINAHEVRLSPATINVRPERVVGAASVVNTVTLEKEPELAPDAAVLNASVVNDAVLALDTGAGAEPGNTAPGEIFVVEAAGVVPANTAPGEIYIHEAAV